jgi:uncharacterized protein DUF4340
MKWKNLVPLIVVLAILVALVVLKKTQDKPVDMIAQVKLAALTPEGFTLGDVAKVELHAGSAPEDILALTRDAEDPDVWRVTSHFNAPADEDKVVEFIEKLVALKGETRARGASDDSLKEYNLGDEAAFHVQAFGKDAEKAEVHILVGKAPDQKQVFVRVDGSNDVYVSDVNFRSQAGVRGEEAKVPEADTWLDKEIVNIEQDTITKVALTTPDKSLVFEKHEKKVEAKEEEKKDGEKAEGEEAAEAEEPEVEYEWALASGGPGGPHKQSGLDTLLRGLAPFKATSVVDPAKKADWGLEAPAFKAEISVDGQEAATVIEAGRPDPAGNGYVRVAGAAEEVIYELSSYTFDKLFPKGTQLFDVPAPALEKDKLVRVEITQPEGRVVFVKEGEAWKVAEPVADLPVVDSAITTAVDALAALRVTDYADSAKGTGLDKPLRKLVVTKADGKSHTIAIGGASKSVDGSYAQFDGGPVIVLGKTDIDKLAAAPKDLYERSLLDISEDDIANVTIVRGAETVAVTRKGDDWTLTLAGAESAANAEAADVLVTAIADLQASDILFGKAAIDGDPFATLTCTMKDGAQHVFTIGAKKDAGHEVALAGKAQIFLVSALDVDELLPAADSLKKPEPKPEPEPAEEKKDEADPAAAPAPAAAEGS